jgi:hypothetical protein
MPVPLSRLRPYRPWVVELEGRLLPSTFMVTVPDDSGPGSLCQAILDNNGTPGLNTIAFDIAPGGVQTIQPASALPTITNPVVIDGTTQPGYAGTPLIELNGDDAGTPVNGLRISAGDSTVTGLVINGFSEDGIFFQTNGNNILTGNYIGTDVTGTQVVANGLFGAQFDFVSDNTVGGTAPGAGNLISGNQLGLEVVGDGNVIQGNLIGTDATGTVALGNRRDGLFLSRSANTVGGSSPGARNLISGNTGNGISAGTLYGAVIQGNYVGTDITGTLALANGQDGINLSDTVGPNTVGGPNPGEGNLISGNAGNGIVANDAGSQIIEGNYIGTDASGTQPLGNSTFGVEVVAGSFNTIGGTGAGAGNLISGNRTGVFIGDGQSNQVQGNFIGTDLTGTQALGNGTGVQIDVDAFNNTVGGTAAGAGNLISGNQHDGVLLGTFGNVVEGNRIGTNVTGVEPLGNGGNGVEVYPGEYLRGNRDTIGGAAVGAGNTIAFNGNDGVRIASGSGNLVSRNAISSDGGLGIELLPGTNNNQQFPTLAAATVSHGRITISGSLQSAPDTDYTVEFFGNDACNPSGYGEGQRFLGSAIVTTDDNGVAVFTLTLPLAGVDPGQYVSATATDPTSDTSAFSRCVAVTRLIPQVEPLGPAMPVTGTAEPAPPPPAAPSVQPRAPSVSSPGADPPPALPPGHRVGPLACGAPNGWGESLQAVSTGDLFPTLGDDLGL